jgi:REP element-mobilizing transposase RayT
MIQGGIMSRPLRIEYPGAFYHLTTRGDRLGKIYRDDFDRKSFLALLGDVCRRYEWRCHAYCLMGNHYHLLVQTPIPNLSQGMRQLNGVHSQRFNRRHGLVGHVFQGRYRAVVADRDAYLLELSRYVVLNPVRAGMVRHAGQWRWSSYREMIGRRAAPAWLSVEDALRHFDADRQAAARRYIRFVREGIGVTAPWRHLVNGLFLGDECFVERARARINETNLSAQEVPQGQRRHNVEPLEHFLQSYRDRREGMRAAVETGGYTLKAIAGCFGVHYATVSRAAGRTKS